MLTVRIATDLDTGAEARARQLAGAIRIHALAPHLAATVIVGTGGTGTLRADDVRPRAWVLLAGPADGTPLAAANVARGDAVVVAERGASPRTLAAVRGPVVTVNRPDQAPVPFLVGPSDGESAAAWRAVNAQPELARALAASRDTSDATPARVAGEVANAVMEALVAAGAVYTPPMERPAG